MKVRVGEEKNEGPLADSRLSCTHMLTHYADLKVRERFVEDSSENIDIKAD